MEKIDLESLIKINKIIERDKLSSSYKLALLKSTIFTIQKYEHHLILGEVKIKIPFFFVIEQWFFDYLPFIINNIRQQHSRDLILNKPLEKLYNEFLDTFKFKDNTWQEKYAEIYKSYFNNRLSKEQKKLIHKLFTKIKETIKNNPMKYIGDEHYEIFSLDNSKSKKINNFSRNNFKDYGYFYIAKDVYNIFKYMGDNLFGINTIIYRWSQMTIKLNNYLSSNKVNLLITHNITDIIRDTSQIRKFFKNKDVFCVWSGKKLKDYDVDHLIPFSIYYNNDLWNLLPSNSKINSNKSDKIPTPQLIEDSKERIIKYWKLYQNEFSYFKEQREISLGNCKDDNEYIEAFKKKCEFLIEKRGYVAFEIK